jgi:(1->4)-alpha-D-glucan 1-alpha-D-glucosylmutase
MKVLPRFLDNVRDGRWATFGLVASACFAILRTDPRVPLQAGALLMSDQPLQLGDCLEHLAAEKPGAVPLCTYRLQFNSRFHFADARRLVPYLFQLGVSHCYSSPILKARAGSPHGYDITDHDQLNPEIGTEEEFGELAAELKARDMGLLLDIVPNHMGVGAGDNPWWQDVLQNGRASAYADFFDIDWEPLKPELRNKVLIPILARAYGEALEEGNIHVVFEDGRFFVRYIDQVLPLDPQTIPMIFVPAMEARQHEGMHQAASEELNALLNALGHLPANCVTAPGEVQKRQNEMPALLEQLRRLTTGSHPARLQIHEALQRLSGTPGDARSFDALHELLEKQAYRLAFWRVSGEEINYRRFFDINDLVGLRMENPRVFAATHKLIRRLLAEDLVSGLRIDHPDGLLEPLQYFMRLQRLYGASQCRGGKPVLPQAIDGIELEIHGAFGGRVAGVAEAPLYLLVEKIFQAGERQPEDWPIDGTVGYDFANLVNGLFIDTRHERPFTELYRRVIDENLRPGKLIIESKKLVMRRALASEVNVLAHMLNEISNLDRRARDFTLNVLREAIRETIACFPVYRTYINELGHVSEIDRAYIEQAIDCAKRQNGTQVAAGFDFLRSILLEGHNGGATIYGYRRQLYFTLKFQQLTGPVMAKGLEDTSCYVYNRFISVNDVGGTPAAFGASPAEFHRANQERAQRWPNSMLSTSTHDSKRSEDVRARLNVLSEMPRVWSSLVMKWRRLNGKHKVQIPDGRAVPDNNEEYLLYQTLVGAWPLHMKDAEERSEFVRRIQQYMEKAVHEAKVNLSWLNTNPDYVAGLNSFVEKILLPSHRGKTNLFWESLQRFLPEVMYFGCINSLSQVLLKLTCPGVPDIYQGQEMWNFSLVDPDNRRPVDFDQRMRAAEELRTRAASEDPAEISQELLKNYRDGRIKLWVTMCALNFRRDHRDLFQLGSYLPLAVARGREEQVVAFARRHAGEIAITAIPRLNCTLMKGRQEPPIGAVWDESELLLPPEAAGRRLRNIFTGETIVAGSSLLCRKAFARFPLALLSLE